jgi:raffinose/stachyose/melibiose transport system substrate-binding protein
MRRLMVMAIILVISAGLVFAGGSQEAPQSDGAASGQGQAAAAQERVELNFFQNKPYLDEAYGDFAAEFSQEYPNVDVVIETIGGGTSWQTILRSKFAADEGPDIFLVEGTGQYDTWSEFIADLTGEAFMDSALPFAMETMNINGRQMGMPVNLEGYGYIYNKDIFAEVGIDDLPVTLSELENAARRIQAAGYTPFATGYATWWVMSLHMLNIAFAHQDDPLGFMNDLSTGEATMADNALFQDLQDLVDLTVEYGEANPLTTDHNRQVQLFANGEVAMIQQGVWKEIPILESNPDANIGVLPMPLNDSPDMDRIPVGVPFYFVVNSDSSAAEQEAARAFLNYLVTSDTGQRYITEEFGFIPAYAGVSSDSLGGIGQDILAYANADKTIPWVFGSYPDGFADDATRSIQAYVAGQHDWATTLRQLDDAWQRRAR